MTTQLEHVNLTVNDPKKTAQFLCDTFGWRVRWQGPAKDDGFTVHVGSDASYLALYTPPGEQAAGGSSYKTTGGLNHVALQVDDLDAIEARVRAAGYTPHSFGDYEPGRRFYFSDNDDVEYEIVQYGD